MSEGEKIFNAIFQTSPDSICITSFKDEIYVDINQGFTNFLGYKKEDVIGKSLKKINIWEEADHKKKLISALDKSGYVEEFEIKFWAKNGEIKYGLTSASYIEIKGIQHLLLITKDISDRKQIENEINLKNRNLVILQEISKELNTSLDTITVSQMITDNSVRLLELDTGAIYSIKGMNLKLEATTPPLPPEFPDKLRLAKLSEHPFIQKTIEKQKPLILKDTSVAELSPEEKNVIILRKLKSLLYVPLVDVNKTLGVMILGTQNNVRDFSESEIDLCETFSTQVTLNFKNALLYENLKKELKKRKLIEKELEKHQNNLEELVKKRTSQLEEKNKELEKFNTLFIGREFRIKELKDKIEDLKSELEKYKISKG
ncbi:MAG: PAS domain S-box protein [Prolixibacteraceae bacterium]|nr:PAS domain S-box protein [Prolixibacteraceae bacterium]MBN2773048.1 PAS domain S-box protein [Prolixibacteraceae bacterium]